ncbi:MAG: hypothetical protein RhofKO_05890 [Rhodothermales bacterium]
MNKIVLSVLLGLVAFVGGAFGIYMAMPYLAPDKVAETQARLDSLATIRQAQLQADSLTLALHSPDSIFVRDSLLLYGNQAFLKSMQDKDQSLTAMVDSVRGLNGSLTTMRDSVHILNKTLEQLLKDQRELMDQVNDLQEKWKSVSELREEAKNITGTLTKLDDGELEAIIANLDNDMLEMMYLELSARNRTRMLQLIPPDRAARFVRRLVTNTPIQEPPPPAPPVEETDVADAALTVGAQR